MRSKRYQDSSQQVDKDTTYSAEDAIKLAKATATTKFDASIELHARLGVDPKKGDQQVRGAVILPHGSGKVKKMAVFATGDQAKAAKEAGADIVGDADLIAEIKKTGKCDFEIALATPDMMKNLAVIARILGTKGLMPSPKNETVTPDIKKAVDELKKGKLNFKNDDTANIHVTIGKASFDDAQLLENFQAFLDVLKKAKPETAKGVFIKNLVLTSSMGPGIKIAV